MLHEPVADATRSQPARIAMGVSSAVAVLLVICFYVWTAGTNGVSLAPGDDAPIVKIDEVIPNLRHYGFYNLLSDGLIAGELSLPITPHPSLFLLSDPYDPGQNDPWRFHDLSLYKGKYYMYFGVTPALILFIPFRALGLGMMPEPLAVAIFCSAGFLFSVLLFRRLVRQYLPSTPPWMQLLGLVCLGLSTTAPFLLRRPVMYEVAISCSYFLVMGGLYWLLTAYLKDGPPWRLALASLFLGLAVGARPNAIFAAAFILLVWFVRFRSRMKLRSPIRMLPSLSLFAPYATCLFLLGLYNHLRFGSWLEIGSRYQLAGVKMSDLGLSRVANIVPGLYMYLLSPAELSHKFPFFTFLSPGYPWALPAGYLAPERVGGVFANMPVTIGVLALPLILWRARRGSRELLVTLCCLAGLGLVNVAFLSFVLPGATMRYGPDYIPSLVLSGLLVLCYLHGSQEAGWKRAAVSSIAIVAIAYGCLLNLGTGMTGYYNLFESGSPATYHAIEQAFMPVSRVLGWLGGAAN